MFCLGEKNIAKFGRQILEGLLFLQQIGIPGYHLHCGNILMQSSTVVDISETELSLLGIVPHHFSIIKSLAPKKVAPNVSCFACVLFEMASGFELESVEAADLILSPASNCPSKIRAILESILKPWSAVPPTIEDLLRLDFFAGVELPQVIPRRHIELQPQDQHSLLIARELMVGMFGITAQIQTPGAEVTTNSSSASSQQQITRKKSKRNIEHKKHNSTTNNAAPIEFTSLSKIYYTPTAPVPTISQPVINNQNQQQPQNQQQNKVTTPPPPPPPPPPPQQSSTMNKSGSAVVQSLAPNEQTPLPTISSERNSLLSSICSFDPKKLKKANK